MCELADRLFLRFFSSVSCCHVDSFSSRNILTFTTVLRCEVIIGKVILNLEHAETYILIGCGPLCVEFNNIPATKSVESLGGEEGCLYSAVCVNAHGKGM